MSWMLIRHKSFQFSIIWLKSYYMSQLIQDLSEISACGIFNFIEHFGPYLTRNSETSGKKELFNSILIKFEA